MSRRQVHHRTVGLLAATFVAAAATVPMPTAVAASPTVVNISQTPTGSTLGAGSLGLSY